jgi:hypothetical protein
MFIVCAVYSSLPAQIRPDYCIFRIKVSMDRYTILFIVLSTECVTMCNLSKFQFGIILTVSYASEVSRYNHPSIYKRNSLNGICS